MAKSLDDVLSAFTPEQRARVAARAEALIEEELTWRDLRHAQHLTQKRMAKLLGVEQENVSRIERRAGCPLWKKNIAQPQTRRRQRQ